MSDDLVKQARSQIGDDVQVILDRDALFERLAARIEALTAENARLTTGGICEVAASNPRVMEYMEHWEGWAEKAEAENAKLREAAKQWLLMEFDDGSKVFLSSISGGGHPHGEFHTVMLRKEMPDGAKFTRELVASSDWMPCVLTTEPPK